MKNMKKRGKKRRRQGYRRRQRAEAKQRRNSRQALRRRKEDNIARRLEHLLGKLNEDDAALQRNLGKSINFGFNYGLSANRARQLSTKFP